VRQIDQPTGVLYHVVEISSFNFSSERSKSVSTPFQRGQRDGQWTEEQIRECGFNSAEDCLKHQEKVHQEELASLADLHKINPDYAKKHAEYLEGIISGTRQSLQLVD
jgi:hypothetical protein